jgi:polyhydroxyalkanoate synthesis regulator protein
VVPQFLAASFEMLRDGPTKVIENMNVIPNPMTSMPGFELMRKQQEAFMKTMMGGVPGWAGSGPAAEKTEGKDPAEELAEIKKQFAELQNKLSKL